MSGIDLTEHEEKVFEKLMVLAGKIDKPENIKTETLFLSVLKMCDAWNIVPIMQRIADGDKVAIAMKGLIEKGLVKQFEIGEIPSFVPTAYSIIKKS